MTFDQPVALTHLTKSSRRLDLLFHQGGTITSSLSITLWTVSRGPSVSGRTGTVALPRHTPSHYKVAAIYTHFVHTGFTAPHSTETNFVYLHVCILQWLLYLNASFKRFGLCFYDRALYFTALGSFSPQHS